MMGRQTGDQTSLFYEFRLDDRIPKDHLLRRINLFLTSVLDGMHEQLASYYSEIGRPSIDPELMVWMLIVGYCYGLRSERKLTQEVELHLAYRWFCMLDLNDKVPHHSTFSENRLHRFRQSDVFRRISAKAISSSETSSLSDEGLSDCGELCLTVVRGRDCCADVSSWATAGGRGRTLFRSGVLLEMAL